MKTLYYITNSKLPTEKAFGYGITKMCESFGDQVEVVLVIPKRHGTQPEEVYTFYGVRRNFTIKTVWSLDLFRFERWIGKLAFAIQAGTFLLSVVCLKYKKEALLYSRDVFLLPFLRLRRPEVFLEIHFLQSTQRRMAWAFRFAKKIITTTAHLRASIIELGTEPGKVHVAHDAVDLSAFGITLSKADARRRLGLPEQAILIGYTGNYKAMGVDKGISNVLRALPYMREHMPDVVFVAVGGMPADIAEFTVLAETLGVRDQVRLIPRVHVQQLPVYQQAFDALLMCPPRTEYFSYHVSPLKMFEYMASHRPIVASDLPGFHEVLTPESALFVDGDNPSSVAAGVVSIVQDGERAARLAARAFRDVADFTWTKRGERILRYIG